MTSRFGRLFCSTCVRKNFRYQKRSIAERLPFPLYSGYRKILVTAPSNWAIDSAKRILKLSHGNSPVTALRRVLSRNANCESAVFSPYHKTKRRRLNSHVEIPFAPFSLLFFWIFTDWQYFANEIIFRWEFAAERAIKIISDERYFSRQKRQMGRDRGRWHSLCERESRRSLGQSSGSTKRRTRVTWWRWSSRFWTVPASGRRRSLLQVCGQLVLADF